MPGAKRKYTAELADWAATVKYEEIPERVVDEAKMQMLSMLGSMFASYSTTAGRSLVNAVGRWSDGGSCTLIPEGKKLGLNDALAGNSSLSMLLDYDDYLMAGHTGHSAVLTPLALAELEPISGRELILAQVIANEIEARIGGSVMVGPLNGQMWAFIHAAGAACAAGRIMGLDPKQMNDALGIAMSQPAYPIDAGFLGGDSKLLTAAAPMQSGILAARFAAEGLEGPRDILEADGGFCETFSFVPLYPMLTRLSECWLSDTLCYKIYPGCAYIDSSMDAVFEILAEKEIDPQNIFKIDVHANIATVKMNDMSRPMIRHEHTHPVTLNFYLPYNIAVGILDGELSPAQFERGRIADPAVWKLARKVRLHHDVAHTGYLIDAVTDLIDLRYVLGELSMSSLRNLATRLGPASPLLWLTSGREISHLLSEGRRALEKFTGISDKRREASLAPSASGFGMAFGARVAIQMKAQNRIYEFEQRIPYGAAGRPLDEKRGDVLRKFKKESDIVIGPEAADAAVDAIFRLDQLDNTGVRNLIETCCVK
ncbi:MmgE/PrpD family protein [bacterium]